MPRSSPALQPSATCRAIALAVAAYRASVEAERRPDCRSGLLRLAEQHRRRAAELLAASKPFHIPGVVVFLAVWP
jgi:hypothetical protein